MTTPAQRERVLVVEDNEHLRMSVAVELAANGFLVDEASSIAEADAALARHAPDCAVFDRMLPDGDAIDYVHRRRRAAFAVPVLFLTSRDAIADRVAGFEHGGDDYLTKPFAMAEMTARVFTLCRRSATRRPQLLRFGNLELDSARREVRRAGALLSLSDKEFALLEYLMARPGQAVARAELIEHCWDSSVDPMSNVVDVGIRRLRAKLGGPELIHAVRGVGYRLDEAGS